MPRNISFALTTEQFLNGTKDVTRRMGWEKLKAGDELWGVKKAMGLKKGEKIERLGMIRIKSVRRERLDTMLSDILYGHDECRREGFPDWHPSKFVIFFCESHGCKAHDIVTRIEFEPIQPPEGE